MATKLGQALWHQMQQSWWRSQYLRVSISAQWAAQRLQTAYCGRPWGGFMGRRPGHSDKKNWRWVSYKLQDVHRYFSRWVKLGESADKGLVINSIQKKPFTDMCISSVALPSASVELLPFLVHRMEGPR